MAKVSTRTATIRLVITALFMALNIVMSMSVFSIPVPGGHLYVNDIIIVTAALLLSPYEAFAVGGIGAFLGDLFFYPAPMFVSLVTHGLQAVVISVFAHYVGKKLGKKGQIAVAVVGILLGVIINVAGYSIGREFIYGTPGSALVKLPYQFAQAGIGAVVGFVLVYVVNLPKLIKKTAKVDLGV